MGFLNKSGSSHTINGLNLILRFLQFAFGVVVLGIYAEAKSHPTWGEGMYHGTVNLAIAAGAISIITAILFGVIPFLVSYYYVAMACLWDWVVFFVWSAAFALTHRDFGNKWAMDDLKHYDVPSVNSVMAGRWFALAAMLVTLLSALMGPISLLMDRKSLFASRATP